jgi:predicted nucleic acid-binding protein
VLTVVFDAGPLITACKFEVFGKLVIDHLLAECRVIIAPSVEEEVAVLGAAYPDGVAAGERIARSEVQVVPVAGQKWERHLKVYALGKGEQDSIALCGQLQDVEALIMDDYLAFLVAARLGLKVWMLPDLIVQLAERKCLTRDQAVEILQAIRPRYRRGVVEHSLEGLREVTENV